MKLYKTGYIVATIDDNNIFSYNSWPLLNVKNDEIADRLTDEADDRWFTFYDMPEIAPELNYVKRYATHCHNIGIKAVILLIETPLNSFEVNDELNNVKLYGYDCIGSVYYSYLNEERNFFKNEFVEKNITLNRNGLFNSIEDVEKFIKLRQESISIGVNLENYWKEMPIRISEVII